MKATPRPFRGILPGATQGEAPESGVALRGLSDLAPLASFVSGRQKPIEERPVPLEGDPQALGASIAEITFPIQLSAIEVFAERPSSNRRSVLGEG